MAITNRLLLRPTNQSFSITFNGVEYSCAIRWCNAEEGGWMLDVFDANDAAVLRGVPLVTGADLLAQYRYLGLGVQLIVASAGNVDETPTFDTLGVSSHLYMVTP